MSISLFETRTLLAAVEQIKSPRMFLKEMFFKTVETFTSEHVDIDIVKGKRTVAPIVNPIKEGKVVQSQGYTSRSVKPGYVKPKIVTTAGDLMFRAAGETVYGTSTPEQRAAAKLGKDLAYLDEMITRREAVMVSQVLQTGKVNMYGDGIYEQVDFGMDATHLPTLVNTAVWANALATPLANLRTWCGLIQKDAGLVPDVAVFGATAWDQFLSNVADVQKMLNLLKVNIGQIDPQLLPDGVTYMGRIIELGLDIYTYTDWYLDDQNSNTETAMVGASNVIIGSTRAQCSMGYGAIKDLKAMYAMPRFAKSWEEEDPSVRYLMTQSAPLPLFKQPDAFVCATVN